MRRFVLGGSVLAGVCLGSLLIMAFTAARSDSVPVGTVIAWAGEAKAVPASWKLCDGSALLRTRYQELFEAIGTAWGAPNAKKFYLPDLRGQFIRGADEGSGRDPDADSRKAAKKNANPTGVGSVQLDTFQNHTHDINVHSHSYWRFYVASSMLCTLPGGSTNRVMVDWQYDKLDSYASLIDIEGAKKFGTKASLKRGEETRPANAAVNFIIKVK